MHKYLPILNNIAMTLFENLVTNVNTERQYENRLLGNTSNHIHQGKATKVHFCSHLFCLEKVDFLPQNELFV